MCVAPAPDRPAVVRVGGTALVPGECAAAPSGRGGGLRVRVEEGRTGAIAERWIRVRRGVTTEISIDAAGRPRRGPRAPCTAR